MAVEHQVLIEILQKTFFPTLEVYLGQNLLSMRSKSSIFGVKIQTFSIFGENASPTLF